MGEEKMSTPVSELMNVLEYDPITGLFTWRISSGKVSKGSIAGSLDRDGYVVIRYKLKTYKAHRLAFLAMGEIPPPQVDHIDHLRNNNIFSNLRRSNSLANSRNRLKNKNNSFGFTGISLTSLGNYRVRIYNKGKLVSIGVKTDCKYRAAIAFNRAVIKLRGKGASLNNLISSEPLGVI